MMDRFDVGSVIINVLVLLGGFAVGFWEGRRTRAEIVEESATETLTILRKEQATQDRTSVMPPLVTRSQAYQHASKRGIGLMEAAAELHLVRARALIQQRIRDQETGLLRQMRGRKR
jgi:hypothetical protein